MSHPIRILHLDDDVNDSELVAAELEADGLACTLRRVETKEEFLAALQRGEVDLILSDFTLPLFNGGDALSLARETYPEVPFVFFTGTLTEEAGVEALKAGATDYVLKNRPARLGQAVRRALRESDAQAERKKTDERIQYLAYHDALTGLGNQVFFREHCSQMLAAAERDSSPAGLILLNLNRFKDVTTALGRQYGDWLLQQVTARLRQAAPAGVGLARIGGDEFIAFLSGDKATVVSLAQSLCHVLEDQPLRLGDMSLDVRCAIGLALFPEHGADPETLLQRAEVALTHAKATHVSTLCFDRTQEQFTPDHLRLLGELAQAATLGHLVLYYQPKISLKTARVVGAEALVRWRHPGRGLLSPERFIPLAEKTGLVKPLTQWAIAEGLRQLRAWLDQGLPLTLSLNLSMAGCLLEECFIDYITALIESSGCPPERITLEVTESCLMADPARALACLSSLHRLKVRLAVDDFGTGYSSLAYLKDLPVDELKIDKSFTLNLIKNRKDAAVVRAATDLGHALGLEVTAEGVEDQQTWHGLIAVGCDTAQGYLMGKPMPAIDFAAYVRTSPYGGGP